MATTAYEPKAFHDALVEAGLIIPVGVLGAFGRNQVFEDVLERLNQLITRTGVDDHAEEVTFPPIVRRSVLESVEYMDSFPQLVGTIHSFFGKDKQARELSAKIKAGEPWGDMMGLTDVVLAPAACYPLYPTLAGDLPENGRTISLTGWVFRHE